MQITWDIIILGALAVSTIYGAMWGKNKVVGALVCLYIALAVTEATGGVVYNFVSNVGFISQNLAVTEFATKTFMMLLLTVLLFMKSEIAGLDSAGMITKVQGGLYGFLLAALAISSAVAFMGSAGINGLDSNFALLLFNYRSAIIAAPALVFIVSSFIRK